MTNLSAETIRTAIADFPDPETGRPIESMGQIKDISVSGNEANVTIALASHSAPIADEVTDTLRSKIEAASPGAQVVFQVDDHPRPRHYTGLLKQHHLARGRLRLHDQSREVHARRDRSTALVSAVP